MSGDNLPTEPRSRGSVIGELIVLGGAALLALFWIIPAQVSGGGMGLDPGFLPRLCAGVIGLLVLADGMRRLWSRSALEEAYPAGWSALATIGGLAVLAAIILRFGGLVATAAVVIPLGMLALGERRLLLIGLTTAFVAGCFYLFLG